MLTQKQIADATGVSRSMIFLVEQRALRKLRAAIEHEAALAGMSPHEWLLQDLNSQEKQQAVALQSFLQSIDQ